MTTPSRASRNKPAKGFTVLELTVVLAVVSVVLIAAFMGLPEPMSATQLESSAKKIASDLHLARTRAVSRNTSMRVVFNPANDTYAVQEDVGGVWQVQAAPRTLPSGIDLYTNNNIVFDADGHSDNAVLVGLRSPSNEIRLIAISAGGRIRVQ